jgi:hypothetical protein
MLTSTRVPLFQLGEEDQSFLGERALRMTLRRAIAWSWSAGSSASR